MGIRLCNNLRNVAFPQSANEIDSGTLHSCFSLMEGPPTEETLRHLKNSMADDTGKKRQDCLGMTPLHILALSTKQSVEVYQLLIERFPEDFVTEDNWGDLPIYYACMINAPLEIIRLLLDSHKAHFPDHVLDWRRMIVKLCWMNAPS